MAKGKKQVKGVSLIKCEKPRHCWRGFFVGATGFEPVTPCL